MNASSEWLETDGLGGFASGTVDGVRTRRYHAVLLTATTPPTGRVALVNAFDAWLETPAGRVPLTSQRYTPGVVHPAGAQAHASFTHQPWPCWTYHLEDGWQVRHGLFVVHDAPVTVLTWSLRRPGTHQESAHHAQTPTAGSPEGGAPAEASVRLLVRPFFSGRDSHATHLENHGFRFDPSQDGERLTWRPYHGLPAIVALSNGRYRHEPVWYRNFQYDAERARGLDFTEDLAAPGIFSWEIGGEECVLVLAAEGDAARAALGDDPALACVARLRTAEKRRRSRFASPLLRAADQYVVRRGDGLSIIAGYPWFSDWGRDTFIALRGLCLATGQLATAKRILLAWAETVSDGMLPNFFPEQGQEPEYNSVDASLWFIIATHQLLQAAGTNRRLLLVRERHALQDAIIAILEGYRQGTRFGIHADADGLLAAGEPGLQLTWMDAKVGDWVVTPRIGKPVEVQALWINALRIGAQLDDRWSEPFEQATAAFLARFWNPERNCLYDVVDVDHEPGSVDPTLRPNQIFAIGGLPWPVLNPTATELAPLARQVVDVVQERLWTPLGLRSLAPGEPRYAAHYEGGVVSRDAAYHQGTVWPWLAGPFIEAWLRVHGSGVRQRRRARRLFLDPLLAHLEDAGLGHLPEIADGDPPHTPRGAPFQAWSLAELLRAGRLLVGNVAALS